MASTVELWTPPPGMSSRVVAEWRAFYRRALDLYGVTPDRYLALYLAQKGRCWICRTATGKHPDDPKGRGGRRLGIDHNHTSGFVRGLLCTGGDKTCNRIIGWLTAPALHRAADYLDGTRTPGLIVGKYGDPALEEAVLWPRETDAPVVSDQRVIVTPDGLQDVCSGGNSGPHIWGPNCVDVHHNRSYSAPDCDLCHGAGVIDQDAIDFFDRTRRRETVVCPECAWRPVSSVRGCQP